MELSNAYGCFTFSDSQHHTDDSVHHSITGAVAAGFHEQRVNSGQPSQDMEQGQWEGRRRRITAQGDTSFLPTKVSQRRDFYNNSISDQIPDQQEQRPCHGQYTRGLVMLHKLIRIGSGTTSNRWPSSE